MMHEYARTLKLNDEEEDAIDKPFTVVKFRTLHEVCRCVEEYQEHTCTHFIKYNRDKHFGNEGESGGWLVLYQCGVWSCGAVTLVWWKIGLSSYDIVIGSHCRTVNSNFQLSIIIIINFWYYFTSSPECSREFRIIFLYYLMHFERVFLITFPSQILSL